MGDNLLLSVQLRARFQLSMSECSKVMANKYNLRQIHWEYANKYNSINATNKYHSLLKCSDEVFWAITCHLYYAEYAFRRSNSVDTLFLL